MQYNEDTISQYSYDFPNIVNWQLLNKVARCSILGEAHTTCRRVLFLSQNTKH